MMSYYARNRVAAIYCHFGRQMMINKLFGTFPMEYTKLFELQIIPSEMISKQVSLDECTSREKLSRQWSELFDALGWTKKTVVTVHYHSTNCLVHHPNDTFTVSTTRKKSKKGTLYADLCDAYGFEIKLRKW